MHHEVVRRTVVGQRGLARSGQLAHGFHIPPMRAHCGFDAGDFLTGT